MQTPLKYRCRKCGCWNRFLVEKRAVVAPTSEAKAKFLIRAYEPLKVEKCTNQSIASSAKLVTTYEHVER